jgi:energy-coupling factor transporter ATP-binding protein EcfA2
MGRFELNEAPQSHGLEEVLKAANLSIDEGEFIALDWPHGCGKSTCRARLLSPKTSWAAKQ